MTEREIGGIRAKTIRAENVVEGIQIKGGDAETARGLIGLAKDLERGSITAEDIRAKNIVSGLQFVTDPRTATPEQLRSEVGELKKNVGAVIDAGEIEDPGDAEDLKEAVGKAEKELSKDKPNGSRVVRALKTVVEILNGSADAMAATNKIQAEAIKLAPTAAAIYAIAQGMF